MKRPLRIAFFLGLFPVVSETFILRQITGLLGLGHQVDVFADLRSPAGDVQQPEVEKDKLIEKTVFMDMPPECAPWELPIRPVTGKTWIPGCEKPVSNLARLAKAIPVFLKCFTTHPRLAIHSLRQKHYGFQAESLSVLYRLRRLLDVASNYDVLHAHFGPTGNSFRFARELWQAPFIVSFHGYDFTTVPRKQGAHVYERLFQTADFITVNSEFSRSRVLRLGAPLDKIQKLPVGLDPEQFSFRERTLKPGETVRILSIGRLVPIKGHEFAIQTVDHLRQKQSNIHYEIVGDGPERSHLEKMVRDRGLSKHVTFCGALAGSLLKQVVDRAHIFLLPSVSIEGDAEGQGLALQEAQAAGLPVVATEHGALPEGMLPDKSGFLVPERNVAALSDRLSYLVEHPEIWPMLGRNGRDFVAANYDIKHLNRQLVDLYVKALS
jgi:colanic acid/amylovoran biosynthesis glycosyltransferase